MPIIVALGCVAIAPSPVQTSFNLVGMSLPQM